MKFLTLIWLLLAIPQASAPSSLRGLCPLPSPAASGRPLCRAAWSFDSTSGEGVSPEGASAFLSATEGDTPSQDEEINVPEIIFGHIGDEYEWHITEWKGKPIAIPLPCIVIDNGVKVFTVHHAAENGYTFNENGKLVNAESGRRPLDLSITKNVLSLMMSSLLLLIVILLTARWYKKHNALEEAPTGLAGLMEPLVAMVHNMARENIGEKDYRRYSPYLCMAFLWILFNNFLGILPFFPGGANLTGNIAITLVLALCTFFTVNLTGTRHYYKELFAPDVPGFLKPIMPIIEVFSALMKPVSLTIRLFANMLAGHIMILSMVCIIFIMAKYGPLLSGGMTVVSVLFGVFLDALECLVAFIQAYVFTMLSSIYIGLARQQH
ncbi:MAG: F0F1 ATP synthase subunit A [Bacteroidales bacterium]|nr:F0F1 ATP synthase subunit A [Bacteroidales bacterium]